MAILFVDGFDHYATADIARKWTTAGNSPSIQSSAGRNSSSALRTSPLFASWVALALGGTPATVIAGAAISPSALPTGDTALISLMENGTEQLSVRLTPSGLLRVTRNGTTLSTSTAAIASASYAYVELKATIHPSAGSYDVHLNGVSVASGTGVNTRATSNSYTDSVTLGPRINSGNNFTIDFDDFYLCDTTGSKNKDFLGDVRIETLYPSGAGASTQFTPSTGANYTAVDEATANTTDYVTSTADNQIDEYAFTDLVTSAGTVKGLQIVAFAQKTDVSAKSIAFIDRTNSADHVGADHALSTSFAFISDIVETDAGNAGIDWTIANVNAAQFGIKSRP